MIIECRLQMDHMDDRSFKELIDCLEVQEFVLFLTISKNIYNQAIRYKKLRQPHIMVINACYGGFGLSDQCMEEMININRDFDTEEYDIRTYPGLVRAILNIGSEKASDVHSKLCFHVYPWMFRNCIKIREYDGMESSKIDNNVYISNLMEKYKKKVEDTVGLDEKKEMESQLFKKLIQKNDFLNSYHVWSDKHMVYLQKRLNDMIRLKSNS